MNEFRICPACGYKRGFHSSFKKAAGHIKVIYICPECGSSFDIGLVEEKVGDLIIRKGEKYE